ncbi:MAG TPA: hypothetical protein VF456_24730 [Vicinamibacterales bacterium]
MTEPRIVCVDFNGVLDDYTGWKGAGFEPLIAAITDRKPAAHVFDRLAQYGLLR